MFLKKINAAIMIMSLASASAFATTQAPQPPAVPISQNSAPADNLSAANPLSDSPTNLQNSPPAGASTVATRAATSTAAASSAPPSPPAANFIAPKSENHFHSPDLSPYGMYLQAHPVVKAVMIALLLAVVLTWAILFGKYAQMWLANRRARQMLQDVLKAQSLPAAIQAHAQNRPACYELLRACATELELSQDAPADLLPRINMRTARVQAALLRKLSAGTAILASIGAISPFVGLFGTVWGIMNAFIGIAKSQTTNLAVVAPGIAEALLATAMGLLAAIPAVLFYNYFSRKLANQRALLQDINTAICLLVSRDAARGQ